MFNRKEKEPGFVLGLYTDYPELDEWIISEVEPIGDLGCISCKASEPNFDDVAAVLCFDTNEGERAEDLFYLALDALKQQKLVIWAVEGPSIWKEQVEKELNSKGNIIIIDNLDNLEAPGLLQHIIDIYENSASKKEKRVEEVIEPKKPEPIMAKQESAVTFDVYEAIEALEDEEDESIAGKIKSRVATISQSIKVTAPTMGKSKKKEAVSLPDVLEKVIAVGGHKGCGSSFLSWNIAAVISGVLMEGRTTGSLSSWIQQHGSRRDFLESGETQIFNSNVEMAIIAEEPMDLEDIKRLSEIDKVVIIDVGDDMEHEAWVRAKKRVFVTAPDPRYKEHPYPIGLDVVKVLNRLPKFSPIPAENVFNMKIDLVVEEDTKQALLSIWGGRPWIESQEEKTWDKWKLLFSLER